MGEDIGNFKLNSLLLALWRITTSVIPEICVSIDLCTCNIRVIDFVLNCRILTCHSFPPAQFVVSEVLPSVGNTESTVHREGATETIACILTIIRPIST